MAHDEIRVMLCCPWKLSWVCFPLYHPERVERERGETKVRKIQKLHRRSCSQKSRENCQSGNYAIKDHRLSLRRKQTVLSPGYPLSQGVKGAQVKLKESKMKLGEELPSPQMRPQDRTAGNAFFSFNKKSDMYLCYEKKGRRDYRVKTNTKRGMWTPPNKQSNWRKDQYDWKRRKEEGECRKKREVTWQFFPLRWRLSEKKNWMKT